MSGNEKQQDRFENVAKDIGCDESEDALDKAFEKINPKVEKEPEADEDQKE